MSILSSFFLVKMMIAGSMPSNIRMRTRPWVTTPRTDWWERVVMTEFQPSDWLDKFRMSQETFFYLCEKLRPRLARQDTCFRLALPVEKRVAVALWRLASNIEYRTISSLFGVGKSTVCRCVRDMCHAIVGLLSSTYLRPPSEQDLEDSALHFLSRYGFPHCVAAISTLHTAIISPSNNASDYANSAGWLSVLSQVVKSWLDNNILLFVLHHSFDSCFFFCSFRWLSVAEASSGMCVPVSQVGQTQLIFYRTHPCGLQLQKVDYHLHLCPPSWEENSGKSVPATNLG